MFVQRQSRPSPSFLTCVDISQLPPTSFHRYQIPSSGKRKEKNKKVSTFSFIQHRRLFSSSSFFQVKGNDPKPKRRKRDRLFSKSIFFFSWIFNRRLFTPLIDLLILSRHFLFPFISFFFFFLKDENPVEWSVNVWDAKEKETVGIESMQWIHQHFYKRWSATCWEAPTFFFLPIARLCCCCCSPAIHNSREREFGANV